MMKILKTNPNSVLSLVFILSASILLAGCNLGGSNDEEAPEQTIITITNTQSHGQVMSDGDGNVLYFFTRDVKGASNCNEGCIENWPAISADLLSSSSGLEPSDFGSIQRNDGTNQTTYRGWPLYYFANDNQPGTVNGDGVNDAWYVANPNYSIMIADEQLVGHDGNNYMSDYTQGDEITTFFTDSLGRTLYRFVNDEHNTNNFTNDDFSNDSVWPIFYQPIDELPSSMDEADFDVIEVHGERQQLTYKGWPLYYFGGTNDVDGDQEPGETRGVSFPQPGVWPIVNTGLSEAPAPE